MKKLKHKIPNFIYFEINKIKNVVKTDKRAKSKFLFWYIIVEFLISLLVLLFTPLFNIYL